MKWIMGICKTQKTVNTEDKYETFCVSKATPGLQSDN